MSILTLHHTGRCETLRMEDFELEAIIASLKYYTTSKKVEAID